MSISTVQCDSNEDLYLPDGKNLVLISSQDAVLQSVRQRTKMRTTENIFDVNEGVDYFGSIFSPQPNYDDARQSISNEILSCPDVVSIESLTIEIKDNTFNYVADIITIYGKTTVSSG